MSILLKDKKPFLAPGLLPCFLSIGGARDAGVMHRFIFCHSMLTLRGSVQSNGQSGRETLELVLLIVDYCALLLGHH